MRIKISDIPVFRNKIAQEQGGKCWLCKIDLNTVVPCLDHDHQTGRIRGVLCQNCNGIEGKINNLARRAKRNKTKDDFLEAVLRYWAWFSPISHAYRSEIHPTHKTEDEKRLRRNKKARERRKKA
jgi:Recombination endonuclease VII